MIVCKVCGNQNEAGAQFCGFCGSFLEWTGEPTEDTGPQPDPVPTPPDPSPPPPEPPPIPGAIVCPNCQTPNEPTNAFCKNCLTQLSGGQQETTGNDLPELAPNESDTTRVSPIVLAGVGVVGIVVLGVFAFLVFGGGDDPDESPTPGPTTTASVSPSPSLPTQSITPSPSVAAQPSGPILVVVGNDEDDRDIGIIQPDGTGFDVLITTGNNGSPSWDPDNERFVYVRSTGLRIANTDGSGDHWLDEPAGLDSMPAWSPNGDLIAFSSRRDGDFEIYTIPVGGGDPTQLTTNARSIDRGPVWSPDGDEIAFISNRAGQNDIWVMDADGKNPRNLTASDDADDVDPAWSPTGDTIVWSSRERGAEDSLYRLFYMNANDGSDPQPALADPDAGEADDHADFSPDGAFIAFHRGGDGQQVLIASVETREVIETIDPPSEFEFIRLPSWQ